MQAERPPPSGEMTVTLTSQPAREVHLRHGDVTAAGHPLSLLYGREAAHRCWSTVHTHTPMLCSRALVHSAEGRSFPLRRCRPEATILARRSDFLCVSDDQDKALLLLQLRQPPLHSPATGGEGDDWGKRMGRCGKVYHAL